MSKEKDNQAKSASATLLSRISQMAPRRLARDLRMTRVNQGFPANSCSSEGGTEWVTAKSVTYVSLSIVL
jgi:hypothetical protein